MKRQMRLRLFVWFYKLCSDSVSRVTWGSASFYSKVIPFETLCGINIPLYRKADIYKLNLAEIYVCSQQTVHSKPRMKYNQGSDVDMVRRLWSP